MASALFHAIGTALGEIAGPAIFGQLAGPGNRGSLFLGYRVELGELGLGLDVEREPPRKRRGAAVTASRQETGSRA